MFDFTLDMGKLTQHMEILEDAAHEAAQIGMEDAMAAAERDARQLARWRSPGHYTEQYDSGAIWEWDVTGFALQTIKGVVIGKNSPTVNLPDFSGPTTTTIKHSANANGEYNWAFNHPRETDSSLFDPVSPAHNEEYVGVVTMYAAYAPYLQRKEMTGGEHGVPSAGLPVTVEVLAVNWTTVYIPTIIKPVFDIIMDAAARAVESVG